MSGEAIFVYGTQKTLEANGASTAAAAFAQADDASLTSTDTADYSQIEFALSVTFSVAPTAGEVVNLYARPLNFDGTNDGQVPSANYLATYVCSFLVEPVTSAQYVHSGRVPLPAKECDFYIQNSTSQTISAGWTLKARPVTIGPAP